MIHEFDSYWLPMKVTVDGIVTDSRDEGIILLVDCAILNIDSPITVKPLVKVTAVSFDAA